MTVGVGFYDCHDPAAVREHSLNGFYIESQGAKIDPAVRTGHLYRSFYEVFFFIFCNSIHMITAKMQEPAATAR